MSSKLEVRIPANINMTNTQWNKQKKDTAMLTEFIRMESLPIVTL